MIIYVIISFNQRNVGMLENYLDLTILKNSECTYIGISTEPYFNKRECMDYSINKFIERLAGEYGARLIAISNIIWSDVNSIVAIDYTIELRYDINN